MTIRKMTTAGIAGITLAATSGVALAAQPQGLYSADQLLEADVYLNNSDDQVGEIEDVILDNNMTIKSFIVESGGNFSLGGKSYVVDPNQLNVTANEGDSVLEPEYRVTLNASSEELESFPVYDVSWWNKAQTQASQAWEQTKDTAGTAWTNVKQGTSNLVDKAGNLTGNAADATGDAVDATGDAVGNAADATGDAVGNAADATGDAANATVDQTGDAVDATGDAAGNAADATGDAANEAADETGDAAEDATY